MLENNHIQVQPSHYFRAKYITLERFINYFYQLNAIRHINPSSILFVGVGDGQVPFFFKKSGLDVVTLDFDPALHPDQVGDVRDLPFEDNSYDLVCAFEVLEHLPWEESKVALAELARVTRTHVLISVPHRRTGVEFIFKFPYIRSMLAKDYLRFAFRIPVRFPGFATSKQHYWEIDGHTTRLNTFRQVIGQHFVIIKEETPVMDMYRRFFSLRKKTYSNPKS